MSLRDLQEAKQDRGTREAISRQRARLRNPLEADGWQKVASGEDGDAWRGRISGQPIRVIWSIGRESDGQPWLHVSLSHEARVPRWEEVAYVKRLFVGLDRYAAQVHPPQDRYVNIHNHVLHLWFPLEAWPLPEFSGELEEGRTI